MLIVFTISIQLVCIFVCLVTKRIYFKWYKDKVSKCDNNSKN